MLPLDSKGIEFTVYIKPTAAATKKIKKSLSLEYKGAFRCWGPQSTGFVYIRAKVTSLPTYCIVSNLCVYTTVTTAASKIKGKIAFAFALI